MRQSLLKAVLHGLRHHDSGILLTIGCETVCNYRRVQQDIVKSALGYHLNIVPKDKF